VNTCSRCGQPVCAGCNYVAGSSPICRQCWDKIEYATMNGGSVPVSPKCDQPAATEPAGTKTVQETTETPEQNRMGNHALLISCIGLLCLAGLFAYIISFPTSTDGILHARFTRNEPLWPMVWLLLALTAVTILTGTMCSLCDKRQNVPARRILGIIFFTILAMAYGIHWLSFFWSTIIAFLTGIGLLVSLFFLNRQLNTKGFAAAIISTLSILAFGPLCLIIVSTFIFTR
jgi:hypothetical protein